MTTTTALKAGETFTVGKAGSDIAVTTTSGTTTSNQFTVEITTAPTAANGSIKTADGYTNTNNITISVTSTTIPSITGTALTWTD